MCILRKPIAIPHDLEGISKVAMDGYKAIISWTQMYPDSIGFSIAYNIYFSTIKEDIFKEGPKLVSINPIVLALEISEFSPGATFYTAVRATEYDPLIMNLSSLPDAGDSKIYSEGILLSDMTDSSSLINVSDIDQFPAYGVVQIGTELIKYTNKDIPSDLLLGLTRGFYETDIRLHQTDGYDGYHFEDPLVKFWKGFEEQNEVIIQATNLFYYPNYPYTNIDGYKIVSKDLLTTDLGGTDEAFGAISALDGGTSAQSQAALPAYDYVGWHRTDPAALLRGDCLGTYYGGEQYCADGYSGVGRQLRGLPIQDVNAQRQEVLLNVTGEPVVLVRRLWTGTRCNCYIATVESPDDRCQNCYGVGFVGGYDQFVNPRRSDGRIMVRFSPTEDDLVSQEAGLESTFNCDGWAMVVPTIKDRDFIIRFNEDGTEEFRYEIMNVTRNKLLNQSTGAQKFRMQRVRKTDPIYQFRSIRDTSTIPQIIMTSVGFVLGPSGQLLPHVHNLVVDEHIVSLSQINQTTSIAQNHNHAIIAGIVQLTLGHNHTITL